MSEENNGELRIPHKITRLAQFKISLGGLIFLEYLVASLVLSIVFLLVLPLFVSIPLRFILSGTTFRLLMRIFWNFYLLIFLIFLVVRYVLILRKRGIVALLGALIGSLPITVLLLAAVNSEILGKILFFIYLFTFPSLIPFTLGILLIHSYGPYKERLESEGKEESIKPLVRLVIGIISLILWIPLFIYGVYAGLLIGSVPFF